MRKILCVLFVLLAGCSGGSGDAGDQGGGDGGSEPGWLDQFPGKLTEVEGQRVKVDESERVVYVQDCDVAREMTASGGPYGPEGGEAGYAYICDQ